MSGIVFLCSCIGNILLFTVLPYEGQRFIVCADCCAIFLPSGDAVIAGLNVFAVLRRMEALTAVSAV